MRLYPAIDIMGGQIVRLKRGLAAEKTAYAGDPVDRARLFRDHGCTHIHVVDLDAAFGTGNNRGLIHRIASESGLSVQTGGGLRSLEDIDRVLGAGVWRAVLGSVALEEPDVVRQAVRRYGSAIAVGLDAENGRLKTRGWTTQTEVSPLDAGCRMRALGVETLIYTDIGRDGMLGEPDVEGSLELARHSGCKVVVSGGVSRIEQIEQIARTPPDLIDGVISGRALYEGHLDLDAALDVFREVVEQAPAQGFGDSGDGSC